MIKPHWRCKRCDCSKYIVLPQKKGVKCKKCGLQELHEVVTNG